MGISKFFQEIKTAKEEKEVEFVYNKYLEKYFGKKKPLYIDHPYDCDGLINKDLFLKLLIEYKYDVELKNNYSRARVLAQVIYYLKRFEENGQSFPNVVMLGDINEVFVMHSNDLLDYLDENIDWSIAPSSAADKNPKLIVKIANDERINPFVFNVDENFDFEQVVEKINNLGMYTDRKVRVTEHRISTIFDYFVNQVIKNSENITPNDLVGIFIGLITDKQKCYKHPNNKNVLVYHGKDVQINGAIYDSFFNQYEQNYTPKEIEKFTAVADRLVEDTKRRRSGEFYTPTLFTDYAHRMLSEQLGEDWKEKYAVWDCCWGTGNLTRDYYFNELYASTLEQAELNCGNRYNLEAKNNKFIFDFLNEPIKIVGNWNSKLPKGLCQAIEQNKPIVFFINPPYGTASNAGAKGTSKEGCAKTLVNQTMLEHKIGGGSQNLYAQFLYQIYSIVKQFNLTNVAIGLFSPVLFLTGPSFKRLREVFLNAFEYHDGIQFSASYFSDVADTWGISFSVWKNGITQNKNKFCYDLVDVDKNDEVIKIAQREVYNLDNDSSASNWAKPIKASEKIESLCFTSAIKYSNKIKKLGKNYLSCFANDANNVDGNTEGVYLINSPITRHVALTEVREDNFEKITTLFAARRITKQCWDNWFEEYLPPNEQHEKWREFVNDSIVFSLFESKSYQSSLRNIECNNQNWNIKNEFFFMSKEEIKELANEYNLTETYQETKTDSERYIYKKLQTINLSKEADAVLNKAIELVKKSFEMREGFNQEHPEYQILNWDCGWYQIKALLQLYYKDDYKQFTELFDVLKHKMQPMVYELGFLKK